MLFRSDSCGWFNVPTKDETRFQYESNHIYREAYKAAEAELATAQQATQQSQSVGTAGLDIRA